MARAHAEGAGTEGFSSSVIAAWRGSCPPASLPLVTQYPGAPERSIEDLKARYYSVARQLLVGREGGPESVANSMLVRGAGVLGSVMHVHGC